MMPVEEPAEDEAEKAACMAEADSKHPGWRERAHKAAMALERAGLNEWIGPLEPVRCWGVYILWSYTRWNKFVLHQACTVDEMVDGFRKQSEAKRARQMAR